MSVTLEEVRLARKRAYDRLDYWLQKFKGMTIKESGLKLTPIPKDLKPFEYETWKRYYEGFTGGQWWGASYTFVDLKQEPPAREPDAVDPVYFDYDSLDSTGFEFDEEPVEVDEESVRYPWSEPDEAWGYDEDDDDDEPLDSLWATPEDIEEEREKGGLEPYDYYDETDEEEGPEPEGFDPYEGWDEDENYWWEDEGYEDGVAPNSFSSLDEMIGRAYDYGSMIGEAFEEAIGNIMNVTGFDEDSVVGLTNNMGDVWEELEKASSYLNVEGSASERAYVIGLNHLNTALSKLYSGFGLTYVRGL